MIHRRLPEKQDRIQVLRKTQAEPYSRLDRIHFRSTTVYISEIRAGAIRQQITRHCQPHDGMRKIKAIYLTKSKPGDVKIANFYFTDGQDE